MAEIMERRWTPGRAMHAEGARVGLVTCLRCGAAILLDKDDEQSALSLHEAFHIRLRLNHADDELLEER